MAILTIKKNISRRIEFLENLIQQADRFKAEPSYAIAKFINIEHRAMMQKVIQYQLITFCLLVIFFFNKDSNVSLSEPIYSSNVASLTATIVFGIFLGASFAGIFSSKTIELYSMTHRLENYDEWKLETIVEIDGLLRRLESMKKSDKNN